MQGVIEDLIVYHQGLMCGKVDDGCAGGPDGDHPPETSCYCNAWQYEYGYLSICHIHTNDTRHHPHPPVLPPDMQSIPGYSFIKLE